MSSKISFGDNVRVIDTSLTRQLGIANLIGSVYGETTPSSTGIEVVGDPKEDFAFNVYFEQKEADYWFPPDLLEFIDYIAGQEMTLDGVSKKWVRDDNGNWIEEDADEA